ncbi:hypothetical protein [Actinoplanes sp. NPDC049316]|uniref:hypothetical protein n=1 Tax=Actinoplanes sp. NPDC049316 TaxID=3154727 RepID=UPI003436B8DE
MGLDVELLRIEQTGTCPRRRQSVEVAVVADTGFRFAGAVERAQHMGSTPMLDRIDLYGTLELSSDEMAQLLDELNQMLEASIDREREVLEAVHRLAVRRRADRNLALRFVGD